VRLAREDGVVRAEYGVLALGSYRFDDALGSYRFDDALGGEYGR
jgi:hypothetical protein